MRAKTTFKVGGSLRIWGKKKERDKESEELKTVRMKPRCDFSRLVWEIAAKGNVWMGRIAPWLHLHSMEALKESSKESIQKGQGLF